MKSESIKIALTGGIGSGKSTALKILKDAGYNTLSSDLIVSDLYQKEEVRKLLKPIFPTAVGDAPDYLLDRKEVAKIAFSDDKKHEELTTAITPLVMQEIEKRTAMVSNIVVAEVPLLFECGYEKYFDKVIVIYRDKSARIESVKARSNLTESEIIARINKQIDYDKLDLSPFIVIKNNGSEESLKEKILSAINTQI